MDPVFPVQSDHAVPAAGGRAGQVGRVAARGGGGPGQTGGRSGTTDGTGLAKTVPTHLFSSTNRITRSGDSEVPNQASGRSESLVRQALNRSEPNFRLRGSCRSVPPGASPAGVSRCFPWRTNPAIVQCPSANQVLPADAYLGESSGIFGLRPPNETTSYRELTALASDWRFSNVRASSWRIRNSSPCRRCAILRSRRSSAFLSSRFVSASNRVLASSTREFRQVFRLDVRLVNSILEHRKRQFISSVVRRQLHDLQDR